jgi:acetoacetyl-CoA synthetase
MAFCAFSPHCRLDRYIESYLPFSISSNPGGVRFGSSELYDVIEHCFSVKTAIAEGASADPNAVVVDCLAVGQAIAEGTDERVILFLQLIEGAVLTPELEATMKSEIRSRRSARHVPAKVLVL